VSAAVAQAPATRDPTKGTGGLARRAMVRGVAGRLRPLLVVIPPPAGPVEGGGRISLQARARGAGGAV
jgi:hypothetical protein